MASTINASSTGSGGLITTGDASGELALQANGVTQATVSSTGLALASTASINALNTFGFENRIINGAMLIDQRNGGGVVTITDSVPTYTTDRWQVFETGSMSFTAQQVSTAPTGFAKSLLVTSTAAVTPAAANRSALTQVIEGFSIADLGWGAAGASTVTLSFWIRSSLTGQFGGALQNAAQNYSYPFSFTINSANTFEFKTITIVGPTTGAWNTDNTGGIRLSFDLGMGSDLLGTAGSWQSADYRGATGDTRINGTNGATLYLTGVQLEKGTQATSFDFRSITQELLLCQRYYYQTTPGAYSQVGQTYAQNSIDGFYVSYPFPSVMRVAPSATISGGTNGGSPASISIYASNPTNVVVNLRSTGATLSVFWVGATLFATAEL
jgi:hypothetical protein